MRFDGESVASYEARIAAAMEAREHAKAELRLEKFVNEQFEQYASPLQQHWVDSILTRASSTLKVSGSDPEAHARSPIDDSPRSSDEHVASGLQDELMKEFSLGYKRATKVSSIYYLIRTGFDEELAQRYATCASCPAPIARLTLSPPTPQVCLSPPAFVALDAATSSIWCNSDQLSSPLAGGCDEECRAADTHTDSRLPRARNRAPVPHVVVEDRRKSGDAFLF